MLVLGIESSCDECSAAIVTEGPKLLGQVVASQIAIHREYGGVVPELASRDHVKKITMVIDGALAKAGVNAGELNGVAVCAGPGLVGSLLVGVGAARTIAWALGLDIVGVEHLEAHLSAAVLDGHEPRYPFLGLVVSGGHTSLFEVKGLGKMVVVGRTLDDAAGEAFDKVAKMLGLEYPGGVSIERAARGGDPDSIRFPRPMPGNRLDFSFSGLKTAALVRVKKEGIPEGERLADFCASFQEAVVDTLVAKTMKAARRLRVERVVVAGGVAANTRLRRKLEQSATRDGIELVIPRPALCTDNAAMVAVLGMRYLQAGRRDEVLELDADASLGWEGPS